MSEAKARGLLRDLIECHDAADRVWITDTERYEHNLRIGKAWQAARAYLATQPTAGAKEQG